MDPSGARIPLPGQDDLPEDFQYLLSEDALGERNVLCAIGNHPRLLQAYMRYGTALWEEAGLPARELEFLILVVARTLQSRYEWHQHVELGREAGLSPETIRAVGAEDWSAFDGQRRALVDYVRSFLAGDVTDADHETLSEHFDSAGVVGVGMVVSHYLGTARMLDAWRVPIEGEFVGWIPDFEEV
jgi:alkylhydroperoxidase family enzyme